MGTSDHNPVEGRGEILPWTIILSGGGGGGGSHIPSHFMLQKPEYSDNTDGPLGL